MTALAVLLAVNLVRSPGAADEPASGLKQDNAYLAQLEPKTSRTGGTDSLRT
jgi:hypothetical protein